MEVTMTDLERIRVGERHNGADIVAVHIQEGHLNPTGVVLGFVDIKTRYVVWTVGPDGEFTDAVYEGDDGKAFGIYTERVAAQLFRHFNRVPPGLSFVMSNTQ